MYLYGNGSKYFNCINLGELFIDYFCKYVYCINDLHTIFCTRDAICFVHLPDPCLSAK